MKKILFIVLGILLISNVCFAEELVLHTPTKEELGGEIWVTGEDGEWEVYTGIDTYEKLYEVLEDVNSRYSSLLEEYNGLQRSYDEMVDEKDEKIRELEVEVEVNTDHRNDDSFSILMWAAIIFAAIIIIPLFKKN